MALLFTVMLVTAAGNTAMQSVMPSIGAALKVEDWWISLAYSWSALLWVVCAPIWARRSDRRGRKSMMALGPCWLCRVDGTVRLGAVGRVARLDQRAWRSVRFCGCAQPLWWVWERRPASCPSLCRLTHTAQRADKGLVAGRIKLWPWYGDRPCARAANGAALYGDRVDRAVHRICGSGPRRADPAALATAR